MPQMPRRVIEHIIEQHAEDAAFLWLQRDCASNAHDQTLKDLNRLDERLEAHIDGLRVAGEWGWRAAQTAFDEYQEPGETFVAAVLAFESRSENRTGYILNAAEASPGMFRAAVSALGWIEPHWSGSMVQSLLDDARPYRRLLGVAACSVHRADPGARLAALLDDQPAVRARTLRLAGQLGRADLLPEIRRALTDPDETCRFWAAWSCALLGDRRDAPEILCQHAGSGLLGRKALQLVLRIMDHQDAVDWLLGLRGDRSKERVIAEGAGIVGDPVLIPWLTTRMREPSVARLAGASFTLITGVDLEAENLATGAPQDEDSSEDFPNEDSMRDEGLAWPDTKKVREWWRRNESAFDKGHRYVLGGRPDELSLPAILAAGVQRHRRAAALEMALASPTARFINCSARTVRSTAGPD